jgi:hypothetical protein
MTFPKPTWRRSFAIIAVSLLIIVVSFVLWASSTNPIMPEAETALQDTATVDVTIDQYIAFMPITVQPTVGYILYPGGRVQAQAYAPLAQAIAEQGYFVAIVFAPLNLSLFDVGAGNAPIADHPEIQYWATGGHSLGGVAAATLAEQNSTIDGLVIMASFPANNALASRTDLQVVSIYATNDGSANANDIIASAKDLPATAQFVAIEGGNHGQFGYYGIQDRDGIATISHAEQTRQVVEATLALLAKLG